MAVKKKSAVDLATEKLTAALEAEYEAGHAIQKRGTQIVLPTHMDVEDAIGALQEYLTEMETDAEKIVSMECHPHDGLHAFYQAMKNRFARILGQATATFFSRIPGELSIVVGYNKTETVPYNVIKIPGMAGKIKITIGMRENSRDPMRGTVSARFDYKRKYEGLVDGIEEEWRRVLREESIFMGKAIDSRWNFLNTMAADTSRLVYTKAEQDSLDANLFLPIRQPDELEHIDEEVRRTILLRGRFGTGKTLTALKAAQVAEENGWTFISVLPGDDIIVSLNFAKRFQPCVVFVEDVDIETQGGRSERLNQVLNTIDGILSKDADVITILTTNRLDHINRAMLRPGRIDDVVELGRLDEQAVVGLCHAYGGDLIDGKLDGPALYKAAEDYVPAFVVEGVRRAKRYALVRAGNGRNVKLTSPDIESALIGMRPQWDLMNSEQFSPDVSLDSVVSDLFGENVEGVADAVEERIIERLSECPALE